MKQVSKRVVERRKGIINAVEAFENKLLEPDPNRVIMGIDISKKEHECTIYIPELLAGTNQPEYYKATYEN